MPTLFDTLLIPIRTRQRVLRTPIHSADKCVSSAAMFIRKPIRNDETTTEIVSLNHDRHYRGGRDTPILLGGFRTSMTPIPTTSV